MSKRRKKTKKQKLIDKQIRKAYEETGGFDIDGEPISYRQFKERVYAMMKIHGITARQAAQKVLNTESFTSAAERSRENLIHAIRKEFPEDYKIIVEYNRRMRDAQGHFVSTKSNLEWSEYYGAYVLGGRYLIDVTDSPKQINIIDLEWENID